MPVDLVLKNAKMLLHGKIVEAGLAVNDSKIVKIAEEPNLPHASKTIDVGGLLVLPGVIDIHVHLRDQELSYKEDFFTGTAAAANGGVTLVADMPNNKPVTMNTQTLRERMNVAAEKTVVNVALYSAFPAKKEEIRSIIQTGAKAFKFFMSQKIGGVNPDDDEAVTEVFKEASQLTVPIAVHAEDRKLVSSMTEKLKKEGNNDLDDFAKAHSPDAELKAIKRVIGIVRKTKAKIHFCHVSTAKGIKAILSAKQSGLQVTCEVTPHHLLLTSSSLKALKGIALTNPPLRGKKDVQGLWSAVENGAVDVLASDHAPHTFEEKSAASVWDIAPGIIGLETFLPLMLTQVAKGRLTLSRLVQMTSKRPAEILGVTNRGQLKEGCFADLTVVDLKRRWKIDASKFYSKAKFSPFDGWKVTGKPVKTFVNGRLVMDKGEILAKPGDGRIIR